MKILLSLSQEGKEKGGLSLLINETCLLPPFSGLQTSACPQQTPKSRHNSTSLPSGCSLPATAKPHRLSHHGNPALLWYITPRTAAPAGTSSAPGVGGGFLCSFSALPPSTPSRNDAGRAPRTLPSPGGMPKTAAEQARALFQPADARYAAPAESTAENVTGPRGAAAPGRAAECGSGTRHAARRDRAGQAVEGRGFPRPLAGACRRCARRAVGLLRADAEPSPWKRQFPVQAREGAQGPS